MILWVWSRRFASAKFQIAAMLCQLLGALIRDGDRLKQWQEENGQQHRPETSAPSENLFVYFRFL
jgi:hypothetical protein